MQFDFSIIRVGMYGLLVSFRGLQAILYILLIFLKIKKALFSFLVLCLCAARLQYTTHLPNNVGSFYGVYYYIFYFPQKRKKKKN